MPTITLTARTVEGLKPSTTQVDYWDASVPGFGLRISPGGRKAWVVLYRTHGRLRRLTLGGFPELTLAEARGRARVAQHEVVVGGDPAAVKAEARHAETIGTLAEEYIERHAKPNKRSWKDDRRMLGSEVLPSWRHVPVGELRRRDVRELVEAIAERGAPILANRVLALVRKMLNFGVEREWLDVNPAAGVRRPAPERRRDRVLTNEEIRTLWKQLANEVPAMAAAFRLRLITGQRSGEVGGMKWGDVDLESSMWTIPGEQAKNGLPHRVPLTEPARKILVALKPATKLEYVLAGARGKRQQTAALSRIGLADFRPHDLRRTAATQMASAGVPRLVISKVLNHVESSVTAIYDRHSYDAEKRQALETWARTLDAILTGKPRGAVVVPIRR